MKKLLLIAALLTASVTINAQVVISQADKDRAARLVEQMTLQEKVSMLGGAIDGFHTAAVERLGIPAIRMCDGPQGVRNDTQSTYYPCGISAAASWSRPSVHNMGRGIGLDAKARGVGFMLGPGVNIYRSALNGRNFEYYGEDPYLASQTAVQYILGMQEVGTIATIKHFALNNSEYDRHNRSSNADERTINEIYFPTFRAAVEQAHVGAVMTSYNPINGTHAPENPWLVRENLRKWGFEGIVMSDWTSTYTTLGCINGGLDLEMPKPYVMNYAMIKPLLDNGVISESMIDEKVEHILQTLSAFGFLDHEVKDASLPEDSDVTNQYAYNLALEAPVLLKNNGVLPLGAKKDKASRISAKHPVVVLGPRANVLTMGGGSGEVHPLPSRQTTLYQGLQRLGKNCPVILVTPDDSGRYDSADKIKTIENASVVVLALGFDTKTESEGKDRTYSLPEGQDDLAVMTIAHNPNTVVVIYSGGEVDITKWAPQAAAIMMAWYPGQAGGYAVADLLAGKVSPSGRLPFTFWGSMDKNPTFESYQPTMAASVNSTAKRFDKYPYAEYKEGIFVGYRAEDHFGTKPMYPFGYGLTYSNFTYSDMTVTPMGDGFDVTFKVTNKGKAEASEVAQLYVAPVAPKVIRPARELKGYDKVKIAAGKSATVTIHVARSAFAYYCTPIHDWKVDAGTYTLEVGANVDDIKLSQNIQLYIPDRT